MLMPAVVALVAAGLFAVLALGTRAYGSWLASIAWLLYSAYELMMHARILCSGECNIRVDLLLIWPLLLGISLAVPIGHLVRRRRTARKPT